MSASLQSSKMQRALRELKQLNEEIDSYLADERAREQREEQFRRELTRQLTGTIFDPPMPRGIGDAARQILERNWREEDSPLRDMNRDNGAGGADIYDDPITQERLNHWSPPTLSANPHSSSLLGSEAPTISAAERTESNSEPSDYDIETDALSPPTHKPGWGFCLDSESLKSPGFGLDSELLKAPGSLADLNGEGVGQLSQTFVSPILKLHELTAARPQVPPAPTPNLDLPKKTLRGDGRSVLGSPIAPKQPNSPEAITPRPDKVEPSMRSNYTGPSISAYKPSQFEVDSNYRRVQNELDFMSRAGIKDRARIQFLQDQANALYDETTQGKALKAAKIIAGGVYEAADAWSEQRQKKHESRPTNYNNSRRNNYHERPPAIRPLPRGGGS